jgi:hypothetical protein
MGRFTTAMYPYLESELVSFIRCRLKDDEAFVYSLCVTSNSDAGYACVLSGSDLVIFGTVAQVQDWLDDRGYWRI